MMVYLAEAYLHTADPFVIEFPSGWPLGGIRWYGVAYLAGFVVAWLMVRGMAKAHRTAIPVRAVADLMIYILVGVLVGGRLGYCVFYDPKLLVDFTSNFPFWDVLAIHKGGMASHGGMLGVIVACWIFAVRRPPGQLHQRRAVGPGAAREHAGQPAVVERQVSAGDPGEELHQALGARQPALRRRWRRHLLCQRRAGGRRGQPAGGRDRAPSQIIQAITDGPILMAVLIIAWWGPRKPGVVGAWFLISYGVMRILTEYVRQPDAGVAGLATPLGELSRGQLLSILMVVIGVVGLVIVARREVEPIGGLVKTDQRSSDS
jgi:phosphatidylglycerol:prolipoprotein diacylglycerol transferase